MIKSMNLKIFQIAVAVCTALFAFPVAPASASDIADKIIAQSRGECRSFEGGVLELTKQAVTRADVSGDGQPDEIIDSSRFSCSSAASLFCGSGGCAVTIIVNDKPTEFLAKGWKIIKWDGQPILLLAVHGSECGGSNLRRCYRAVVWSDGKFQSVARK